MSTGVVQLIAVGAQDKHIMGEPEISFFSSTFKRHSNFSQSVEKQLMRGNVSNDSMTSIKFENHKVVYGAIYSGTIFISECTRETVEFSYGCGVL